MCQDQKRLEFFSPQSGNHNHNHWWPGREGPRKWGVNEQSPPSSLGLVTLCRSQATRCTLRTSSCRSVVQLGVILSSWGLWARSGDVSGCYNWVVGKASGMGWGQECCSTRCNAQNSPPDQEASGPACSQASQVMLVVKNLPTNAGDIRDVGSIPRLGRSPRAGMRQSTLLVKPRESHGQRSLVGCKESDTTEVP